jgi:hypothetical protein
MVLGLLRNLYKDRDKWTTMGDISRFFLSDSHFQHRRDRVIDLFGEDARREVAGHIFSSGSIES